MTAESVIWKVFHLEFIINILIQIIQSWLLVFIIRQEIQRFGKRDYKKSTKEIIFCGFFIFKLRSSDPSFLQILQNKIGHFFIKLRSGLSSKNTVILVRICHKIKLFFVLNQGLGKLHRVLEMHVIIGCPVD